MQRPYAKALPCVAQAAGGGRGHPSPGVRHCTSLSTFCVLRIEFHLISPTTLQQR